MQCESASQTQMQEKCEFVSEFNISASKFQLLRVAAKFTLVVILGSFKLFGFPGGSTGRESTCNAGELASIPGLGRSPGEVKGYPLQYSGLENSMDYTVHGVTESQTQLSDLRICTFNLFWVSLMAQLVKNLPAMWET